MWLEHLLLLSMLQHESGAWTWGRYVVVHPAGNPDVAELCARYRELLADASTFASMTARGALDAGVLPAVDDGGPARALPARLSRVALAHRISARADAPGRSAAAILRRWT